MPGARYAVVGDISQFYSSIYTHSIAWALEGRAAAKKRLRTGRRTKTTGDHLDKAIANCQSAQTKGIPVGPDTSFCVSELILCSVDDVLQKMFPLLRRHGVRYADDLEVYVASRRTAEDILLAWEREIAQYELLINPDKTGVYEGPFVIESPWKVALQKFDIRTRSDRVLANDFESYFSVAFDLAKSLPRESVINYAGSRMSSYLPAAGRRSWRVLFELFLASITAEPASIRVVARRLDDANQLGLPMSRSTLSTVLNDFVSHHAMLRHGSEVSWALWLALRLGIELDESTAAAVVGTEDDPSLCLLLLLNDAGLVATSADLGPAKALAEAPDAPVERHWLYAYEAALRGWASPKEIRKVPQMKDMRAAKVTFLDVPAPAPRRRRKKPAAVPPKPVATVAPPARRRPVRRRPSPVVIPFEPDPVDADGGYERP